MDMEDIRAVLLQYNCTSGCEYQITSDADEIVLGPLVPGSSRITPPLVGVPVLIIESTGDWCVHVQDALVSRLGGLWTTNTGNGSTKVANHEGFTYTRLATTPDLDS